MIFGFAPGFFALVIAVGLAGFLLSSVLGIGGTVLLIPVLSLRMPASQAVALSAPILLFHSVLKGWVFRRSVDVRAFGLITVLAVPAAAAGAYFSARVDDRFILGGVALLIVSAVALERGLGRHVRMPPLALVPWGALTGAISGLCGAAGPPTAIGLRGYGLDRERFVGTIAWFAIVLQAVKLPAYLSAGSLPESLWPLAALLAALAAISALVAPRLLARMPARVFAIALDALLVLAAVAIVVDVSRR